MKTLKVFRLNDSVSTEVEKLHSVLNDLPKHLLEFHLWKNENDYTPKVQFCVAHNQQAVILKFFVEEKEIRAQVTENNGPVWEDSCVEFFVSFDESGYYNFEFNCLGTVLAAFGENRNQRIFLPQEALKQIQTSTRLYKNMGQFYWELLVIIPLTAFVHHSFSSLSGTLANANFYKCGDGLSHPHYLCWSAIESPRPDFHLPQFFGEVVFE